jgi:hypothetical protein
VLAVGAFLLGRAQRAFAGAGALVAALAVWMAYLWRANPGPFLWPVVFIIAVGLIAYGTRHDVWAFNGGNFLSSANGAVQRGPPWFLEVPYNTFLAESSSAGPTRGPGCSSAVS